MVSRRRYKIDLVILLIVLVGGVFGVKHAGAIGDLWHSTTYMPPAEVQELAAAAGMSEAGKKLFYRFSPQITDQAAMFDYCGPKFGCVEGRHIYILRDTNEREYNRAVVTAAHEMLHVAFSRLPQADRLAVELMLNQHLSQPEYKNTAYKILFYRDRPELYLNEAHSYFGSEVAELSDGLETHYARYFDDRSKVTTAYRASPEGQ